jgi:hypothetical protein
LHISPRRHAFFARQPASRLCLQGFAGGLRFGSGLMRLRARRTKTARPPVSTACGQLAAVAASQCTEFGQRPVDEPHLIENSTDKVHSWELTLLSPGVDSATFFDRFRTVFPVGGESGAQAQLTAVRTAKKAGIAGQRSWFRQAHAAFAVIGLRARTAASTTVEAAYGESGGAAIPTGGRKRLRWPEGPNFSRNRSAG